MTEVVKAFLKHITFMYPPNCLNILEKISHIYKVPRPQSERPRLLDTKQQVKQLREIGASKASDWVPSLGG